MEARWAGRGEAAGEAERLQEGAGGSQAEEEAAQERAQRLEELVSARDGGQGGASRSRDEWVEWLRERFEGVGEPGPPEEWAHGGRDEGQEAAGPYLVARLTGDGSEAVTGGRARWAARAEVGTDGGCTGWRERSEAWCEWLAVDEDGYVVWLEGGGELCCQRQGGCPRLWRGRCGHAGPSVTCWWSARGRDRSER